MSLNDDWDKRERHWCCKCQGQTQQIFKGEYIWCLNCGRRWYKCKKHLRFTAELPVQRQKTCGCYRPVNQEDNLKYSLISLLQPYKPLHYWTKINLTACGLIPSRKMWRYPEWCRGDLWTDDKNAVTCQECRAILRKREIECLPDSDFAIIRHENGEKKRYFPMLDSSHAKWALRLLCTPSADWLTEEERQEVERRARGLKK